MWRRIRNAALLVIALAAAAAAWVFFDVTRGGGREMAARPGERPPSAAPPTPQERRRAEQTAARVRKAIDPAAGAAAPLFELRMSEQEANEMLRALPEVGRELGKRGIGRPRVRFDPGLVTFSARVRLPGRFEARVGATATVSLEAGRLRVRPKAVKLGSFEAPAWLKKALGRSLASVEQRLERRFPGTIEGVELRDRLLVVRGRRAASPAGQRPP